ncbi:MAG: hypothetical protein ABSA67_01710 [Candidatus Brocadiia bacterium]|jgi:hypothetical protein
MDDRMDEFEERLRSLRPVAPAPDLERRVSAGLAGESADAKSRVGTWVVVAAGLMAAMLAICIALAHLGGPAAAPRPLQPVKTVALIPHHDFTADDPPTRAVYGAAMMRSPETLDALMDKHARSLMPPDRDPSAWRNTVLQ